MHRLELKLPPLLLAAICAAAMAGIARATPKFAFDLPARLAVAIALSVCGALVALAGVAAFRNRRTTVNPMRPGEASAVVTGGIYRYTRNPMYLGVVLALAGLAMFLSNAAAALLLPAFVAYLNRFQIGPEERALLSKFGQPFADYLASVRRWI